MHKKDLESQLEGLFSDAVIPKPLPEPAAGELRAEPPETESVVVQAPSPEERPTIELPLPVAEPEIEVEARDVSAELTGIKRFLAAPVFEDEEKTRIASLLNTITLATLAVVVMIGIILLVTTPDPVLGLVIDGILVPLLLGVLSLTRRGRVQLAGVLLSSALWGFFTFITIAFGGLRSPGPSTYLTVALIAGFLLGGRVGIGFAGLSVVAGLGVLYAEIRGVLPPPLIPISPVLMWAGLSGNLIVTVTLLHIATRNINDALDRARRNERSLAESNRELQASRAALETRTADLEHRAMQLQAVAEISRAASSLLAPTGLMHQAVDLIHDRFDYYYVGLFLVDATGRWAVLHAGTGEAGREMLAQGYRLEVGGNSMIGWCTAHGQARIALDVGKEAVRFDNPLLPETRSEMAAPLISRGRIIGALTVQSAEAQAFSDEDVSVLQTMADQVANAIENTRLLQETGRLVRRNQLISEVSGKLRGTLDLEEVLQTTVRELGLALGASEAVIRLGAPAPSGRAGGDGHGESEAHLSPSDSPVTTQTTQTTKGAIR